MYKPSTTAIMAIVSIMDMIDDETTSGSDAIEAIALLYGATQAAASNTVRDKLETARQWAFDDFTRRKNG